MLRNHLSCLALCASALLAPLTARAVVIDTVLVSNVGNAPTSQLVAGPLGAVGYAFGMGTFEVTNAQYVEFLNAKAGDDPLGLYDPGMATGGGISRSGPAGGYSYAPATNMADKPVNYVNYYDALRFANWMHNGQGPGDTEAGSYTLLGGTPVPTNFNTLARSSSATWVVPTADEWVKAAYYDPRNTAAGGPADDSHYWLYPTASDSTPTKATADSAGNISNPGANVANYGGLANWNASEFDPTTVGSAGPFSASHYGTFDQGGNVFEWSTSVVGVKPHVVLGGAYAAPFSHQFLTIQGHDTAALSDLNADDSDISIGFRLVHVPEPGSVVLATFGLVAVVAHGMTQWRRRRS